MPPAFTPTIQNPYPENYNGEMIPVDEFEFLTPLILRREVDAVKMRGGRDDADYIVGADYKVRFWIQGESAKRTITVPKGMLTDLASVPRFAQTIVARVGPHLEASILHDFLYVAWQDLPNGEARRVDWNFADELFHTAMRASTVAADQVVLIHASVRAFGWPVYRKKNDPPRYVRI
jgi:hypothetical protein